MPTPITRDELQRLVREENAQIVDVLPSREYSEGHLPGAINIPLKKLNRDTAAVLDRARQSKRHFERVVSQPELIAPDAAVATPSPAATARSRRGSAPPSRTT